MKPHQPHVIRLREPWDLSATADGSWTLARRFRQPTGLRPEDRVELVVGGVAGVRRITCNGSALQIERRAADELRGEIRHLLRDRNQVDIVLDPPPASAAEWESSLREDVLAVGLVRLEIHPSEFSAAYP